MVLLESDSIQGKEREAGRKGSSLLKMFFNSTAPPHPFQLTYKYLGSQCDPWIPFTFLYIILDFKQLC